MKLEARAEPSLEAGPGAYVLVRGQWDGRGWRLLPIYEMELAGGPAANPDRGSYCLEFAGARGALLGRHCFNARGGHADVIEYNTRSGVATPPSFSEVVPLPAGVIGIALTQGGTTLTQVSRSANAPTVQLLSPAAGGFRGLPDNAQVVWSAQDGDRDRLS